MTIGIGKFNRSSNFLGPGPKKCRNKSLDFSEFQLVFGSPILFTYVGIEEPSTATISPEKPFSGFVLASTLYISSHLFFLLTWTKPKRGCYYTGARSTWNYFVLLTKKCYYGKWKWPLQNMDLDAKHGRVTFIISEKRPRIVTLHDFQISKIMDGP